MFDEAKTQLEAALTDAGEPITTTDAKDAIEVGVFLAEQAIDEHATTEERDGETYITAIGTTSFSLPPQTAATGSSSDAESDETETEGETSIQREAPQTGEVDLTSEERETYELNGLSIDVNPQQTLAGQPTGDNVFGAAVLTNHHPDVPDQTTPYHPVELANGERDSEDVFFRLLGNHTPIILEGEAGSGKNLLARYAASRLKLPMYRQEFGADTSVMDMVGEKDLDGDGGTYYILGKAAKAAIFGGLYVADEINMATGSVTSYLHPLFEDRGARELELRGTGRTLRDLPEGVEWNPEEHLGRYIHPHFYTVGTCNPLHYADTNPMNDALRSRCTVIKHPYLATSETDQRGIEDEAQLLAEETGCTVGDVKGLVKIAAILREAREAREISVPIGHRELRDTVRLAGPNQEFMSFADAAHIKMGGQASMPKDRQFIEDTLDDESALLR